VLEVRIVNGGKGRRTRLPRSLLLVVAAAVAVIAGAAFFLLRARDDALDHPANPLSDDQTKSQVIEPTKQIVALTRMHVAAAGYTLLSCKNETDPPYQGLVYLTFDLPNAVDYFDQVAATMVPHGWHKGLPPTQYVFGTTLTKDGVTAILYRDPDRRTTGVMKVYGECRNTGNHRNDNTGWTDITAALHA